MRHWLCTLLVFLVACSSGGGPTEPSGNPPGNNDPPANDPPAGNTVSVGAVSFTPSQLQVTRGTTVIWNNDSGIAHNIIPVGHTEFSRVDFSQSGEVFRHTFNNAGTFNYLCDLHGGMNGSIVVQ